MKKLIFFLIGIVALISLNAQTPTSSPDVVIRENQSWGWYTGVASDTINGTTTTNALFQVLWNERYTITYFVSGDTLNGCSGNVTIQPQYSYDGVTFANLGSSVTWTTTANYDAATSQNTYTIAEAGTETNASHTETMSGNQTPAQHTETTATFNITADTTGINVGFADTLKVAAQTNTVASYTIADARVNTVAAQTVTVAVTNTVTLPGTDARYIRILLTGLSGARVELQNVGLKLSKCIN